MIENKRNPSILHANFLFLIIALLLISVGGWIQSKNLFLGVLVVEYIIILVPILMYLRNAEHNFKEVLRLNKISFKQILHIVLIVIFSYPIAVFYNYIGVLLLSRFGSLLSNPVPIPTNLREFLIGFIIISLTPGICEEVMFRGLMMTSYERLGKWKAILYSAILFGIFHFNLQNLLGPIFLGIIFGILVFKTDSIFSGILAHTINNTIALWIGFSTNNSHIVSNEALAETMPGIDVMLAGVIGLGLIAFFCNLIVIRLLKSIPSKDDGSIDDKVNFANKSNRKMSIKELIPIILVVLVFLVYNYIIFLS